MGVDYGFFIREQAIKNFYQLRGKWQRREMQKGLLQ